MEKRHIISWIFILPFIANAQNPIQIKGVFPKMAVVSDHNWRTEAGIGALIPWANKFRSHI